MVGAVTKSVTTHSRSGGVKPCQILRKQRPEKLGPQSDIVYNPRDFTTKVSENLGSQGRNKSFNIAASHK